METANPETPNLENMEIQNPDSEKQENIQSSFPVLPFAIIGGVILASCIAVIAVLAKRRKDKVAKP